MDEYDVLGGYIPSFVQHLTDTRTRLGIGIRPQVGDDLINEDGVAGEATNVHAPSGWTSAEHDAFFRALSVYSRWRPDLVAACVRTKTEWEVWMYLEALEEGAATLAMEQSDADVDVAVGGSGDERRDTEMQVDDGPSVASGSRSDMDGDGDVCEPALEVSQAWIDLEERMAAWIVQEEHLASVEGDAASDTADVVAEPRKRKRGRPRGTGRGRVQAADKEDRDPPLRARHSSSPEPSSTTARKASTLSVQEREGLMGRLEAPHLLVLDGILRESEEASKSREDSATLTELGDEGALDAHDVRVPSPPDWPAAPQGTISAPECSSNVVIDPVLLALSGDVGPGALASFESSHVPVQGPSLSHDVSSQPAALRVEVPSQPGSSTVFTLPPDGTTQILPCPPANGEPDLSLFSPRSRRRIQKRLYMRRKRAQTRDNNAASEGTIDTGIQKLRPGKKAKPEQTETPVVSTSVACSEGASDADVEATENVARKNKGGLTLPYKLKARFAELGVDAAYLGGQGMDLLNLGALGKRMGLCSSLDGAEEEAIVQSIDAQLIQHLQAAMVSFVADVVHRAIVWREKEIRLKQRSQAWRQGNHITVAAIEHAVEVVGVDFASPNPCPASAAGDPDPAKVSCADPDVEATDRSPELPRLSPHRDVYAPLIRTPPKWGVGALACFTRTYEREATRTRRGPSADVGEEELMSDETDEEGLDAELGAEDALDAVDVAQAAAAEGRLWEGMKTRFNLGAR